MPTGRVGNPTRCYAKGNRPYMEISNLGPLDVLPFVRYKMTTANRKSVYDNFCICPQSSETNMHNLRDYDTHIVINCF